MELEPQKHNQIDILEDEEVITGLLSRVLLFNDNWHTFDEVIFQLIKAIGCTYDIARGFAFEVHVKGKCIVYNGEIKDCLKVSSVLEEIALSTQILT
ncbi:MAG TPA: ATP-dependent Clp protease adaptor ClpS [Ignavibacteriaceae bacterium]|nr:ATP-dependent Clp protease adaptor ClpS [Ignavibacteriaceae bacterium]